MMKLQISCGILWFVIIVFINSRSANSFLFTPSLKAKSCRTFPNYYYIAIDVKTRQWQRCALQATADVSTAVAQPATSSNSNISPSNAKKFVKIVPGNIVQYSTDKGSSQLVLVRSYSGKGNFLVYNELNQQFTLPIKKVRQILTGQYNIQHLKEFANITKSSHLSFRLEKLWTKLHQIRLSKSSNANTVSDSSSSIISSLSILNRSFSRYEENKHQSDFYTLEDLCLGLYGEVSDYHLLAAKVCFENFGGSFFESVVNDNGIHGSSTTTKYIPLPEDTVLENIREQAVLLEFKQRFLMIRAAESNRVKNESATSFQNTTTDINTANSDTSTSNVNAATSLLSKDSGTTSPTDVYKPSQQPPTIPDSILKVIKKKYVEGVKEVVFSKHPMVNSKLITWHTNHTRLAEGEKFLQFLNLAPSSKNAKTLLEKLGIWSVHENVERLVAGFRHEFPADVLEEADYLLQHALQVEDPDERLRVDLRHLSAYSIDNEAASEIDDAISIEYLEDGREKVWIHIADVSRWIRPGSALSLEAERRMSTIYLADDRIPMFPERLSTELLSLGVTNLPFSYAISCGVELDQNGEILSYQVCPTKVRITRKITYHQIDEILEATANQVQRLQASSTSSSSASSFAASTATTKPNLAVTSFTSTSTTPSFASSLSTNIAEMDQNSNLDDRQVFMSSSLPPTPADALSAMSYTVSASLQSTRAGSSVLDRYSPKTIRDVLRLNHWASVRHAFRKRQGRALDDYLRDKTELSIAAKVDGKPPHENWTLSGYFSWTNTSSSSTVSEYMILMSQTIGLMASKYQIPVIYKVQKTKEPVTEDMLQLQDGETSFLRTMRLLSLMTLAKDSKTPGPHVSSGSFSYVQCTSPIRRYHDLYNHYVLKATMHAASLSEEYAFLARETAGINTLENMRSIEEREAILKLIRLIVKNRERYWMRLFLEKMIYTSPKLIFEVVVLYSIADQPIAVPHLLTKSNEEEIVGTDDDEDDESSENKDTDSSASVADSNDSKSEERKLSFQEKVMSKLPAISLLLATPGVSPEDLYVVSVLELGSNKFHVMYAPGYHNINGSSDKSNILEKTLFSGQMLGGKLYCIKKVPDTYLILPESLSEDSIPENIQKLII